MFTCMMFLGDGTFYKTESTDSKEEAMKKMENLLKGKTDKERIWGHQCILTYRPADGTVYLNYHHIPRGVVFKNE